MSLQLPYFLVGTSAFILIGIKVSAILHFMN